MKYFYSYLYNGLSASFTIQLIDDNKLSISKECIYIDINNGIQWNKLKKILKENDELYIYDILYFADEINQFKERLLYLKELNIELKILNETILIIDQILNTTEFVQKTMRKNIYEKQMEGIHRALEKKKSGEGEYGRPKIILPKDFEDNIKKIMRKEMKHEDYREQLGFKRSTYFKFVKDLKDSWKQQELERSLNKSGECKD
ncbi:hypothetical protein DWW36_06350 [Erysipelotrichaceae bacterium AF15-26LB]|nr:hypothetical protein HMPREF0983_03242 [Erysipelotrichaceae bacterium 3_1_53]MCR0348688.1 hypothetical protein [[Clostridium] innocuum]RJV90013.1 hypothetical protein DWX45_09945 [Erysipelotrichaceae bacterium AF19-24AC]RJV90560.1 hypothetical protein DWW36_06350 [Erysipelotrichaceae bacterium AF15-26LB]